MLDVGAGPDGTAGGGEKDVALVFGDFGHGDVANDGPDEGADDLDGEGDAWGDFGILSEFEVLRQADGLGDGVVTEESKVKIGNWLSWVNITAQSLHEVLWAALIAGERRLGTEEEREDASDENAYEKAIPRECGISGINADQPDNQRGGENDRVPPVGALFVCAHELVMWVVVHFIMVNNFRVACPKGWCNEFPQFLRMKK